jgi:hypothetical protein
MSAIASTGRRLTPKMAEALGPQKIDIAVTATKHVKAGGMVMLVAAGTCEPGATGTGNVCLGVSQSDYDNSSSLSPAPVAHVEPGNYSFFQTGTTITKAHIGTTVYMADDQTVTLSSSGNSPAGTCVGIDDDGTSVIVAISPLLPITSHGAALQTRSLTLEAGVNMTASPDDDDQNLLVNIGAVLPAGAIITGHMLHLVTPFTGGGVSTLSLAVGCITPVDDFDSMVTAYDLTASANYSAGTLGDVPDSSTLAGQVTYGGAQLRATVNPDSGTKTSDPTAGKVIITVFFIDATDY